MRILVAAALLASTCHAADDAKVFELAVKGERVDVPQATLRVRKGERVQLRWTSDRPIALHLHGYDIEARATPQSPGTMSFTASIAGRFPVSEHVRGPVQHRAILYLEVRP